MVREENGKNTPKTKIGHSSGGRLGSVIMLSLILVLVVIALGANSWKRDLPVGVVRVQGNSIVSTAEILRLAAIPPGAKLFSLDIASIQRRLKVNPYLRSVTVNRQGPEGISIAVEERKPIAVLIHDPMFYVDEEGVVLPGVKSERLFDLPVLTGSWTDSDCAIGRRMTKEPIQATLRLLVLSRRIGDDLFRLISEVHIRKNGDLVLHTADAGVPVLMGQTDLAARLLKFDAFWRQIVERKGPQQLELVDLRFEEQIVARWTGGVSRQ
jgi:cell division protein FtsQ